MSYKELILEPYIPDLSYFPYWGSEFELVE